ncbi:MAG: acyl CoA:acetate/3-ketoacid CoA transferase beta subunit [Bradymonadia bacterium]|jgi:acyl CoA:acetate/3-ketoacid CoA transferase beta subunit
MSVTRAEVCAVAIAEIFRGDGEIMVSPMGLLPAIGARLAKLTFEPDMVLSDGVAGLQANVVGIGEKVEPVLEGVMPYRKIFDLVWWGHRHVLMGATQIDSFGNTNISAIGDWDQPKVQLLGARGAPGNTICHPTSYWIANHSKRAFVETVDFVSGVGYDRAAELGEGARFHEIRRVVTNLGVFDFESANQRMRIRSLHPGVTVEEVQAATGFELVVPDDVPTSRLPTAEELTLLRERIDPSTKREREVPNV